MKVKFYFIFLSFIFLIMFFSLSVSAARLPTIDGDSDNWGTVLNEYLTQLAGDNATDLNVTGSAVFEGGVNVTGDLHMVGAITHDSPVEIRDGITLTNDSNFHSFSIYNAHEESGAHEDVHNVSDDFVDTLIFQSEKIDNPNNMEICFWDRENQIMYGCISEGGTQKATTFRRSFQIAGNLTSKENDANFTLCEGNNFVDCLTDATGADLLVHDDIEAQSIYANENFQATGNLTLGQKITFTLGEVIDNFVDGWITITGGLNVTNNFEVGGDINVTGLIYGNGSQLTSLTESQITDLQTYATNNTAGWTLNFSNIRSNDWTNISITESQISNLAHIGNNGITLTEANITDLVHTINGTNINVLGVNASSTTIHGDLNVTGTSYLGDITLTSDNITVNNILNKSQNGVRVFSDLWVDNNVGIGTISPTTELEVVGDITSKGTKWTSRTSSADNSWKSVTYGNGLFVAVAITGTSNRVMTSPDGITWTNRTSASDNKWHGVTYGNGLFVAVSWTGSDNRVMTSPDGITWTNRTSASDSDWLDVTYGNGLFVAVSTSDSVMTSPDGITWTSRTGAADNEWISVIYGDGVFVAVSYTGTDNRVMTSPDGITWTSRTSASDNQWNSVTYGNGLFVAVAKIGTGNQVMTSSDGITWTNRTSASDNQWRGVTYGNGLFAAVAINGSGNRVMTSPDGITWTSRTSASDNDWQSVTYGNGVFVAIALSGTGDRVMTSGKSEINVVSHNNIYQGGIEVRGDLNVTGTSYLGDIEPTNESLYQLIYGNNDNLILYLPFSEPNGSTQYDRSPNGNDGTLVNGPICNITNGKGGGGCSFDGVDDYITVGPTDIPSEVTVSAWVFSHNFSKPMDIIGKSPVNTQWQIFFDSNLLIWRGGGIPAINCATPSNDKWHYITGHQTGTTATLYIDGVQCSSGEVTAIGNGGGNIEIGRYDSGHYFNGTIDEVLVYNRVLTAKEIRSHYLGGSKYDSLSVVTSDKFRIVNASGNVNFIVDGSSGNIGIGTANPGDILEVYSTDSSGKGITIANPRPTILFNDTDATDWNIGMVASDFVFEETVAGRVLTLDSGTGNVGIGTSSPQAPLHVNSTSNETVLRLQDVDGACLQNPEAGSLTISCSSDEKLKENIKEAKPVLGEFEDIEIKDYIVKASGKNTTGVIAQEINETHPELVHVENGELFVEQPNPWKLLKAIQELGEQIKQLQTQINNLISGGEINATIIGNNQGVSLSKDSIGQATILVNKTETRIIFEKEYDSEPIVTITPIGLPNYFHGVTNVTTLGFTIKISKAQNEEITFNWHAFGQVVENKADVVNETIVNKTNNKNINKTNQETEVNITLPENKESDLNITVPNNSKLEINETEEIINESLRDNPDNNSTEENITGTEISPITGGVVDKIITNDSEDNIEEETNGTLEKPLEELVETEDNSNNLTEEELALLNG